MVVALDDLRPFLTRNGVLRDRSDELLHLIATNHFFIDRDVAEVSPEYRQIIPYVVIRHGDECFVLRRTRKQTEARLHDKVSLGIGGHINPGNDLRAGLQKELDEEVRVGCAHTLSFVGILNDDSTEVGRVHLGAVYLLDATSRDVEVLETEKMRGEWMPIATLGGLRESMETWSAIVLDEVL